MERNKENSEIQKVSKAVAHELENQDTVFATEFQTPPPLVFTSDIGHVKNVKKEKEAGDKEDKSTSSNQLPISEQPVQSKTSNSTNSEQRSNDPTTESAIQQIKEKPEKEEELLDSPNIDLVFADDVPEPPNEEGGDDIGAAGDAGGSGDENPVQKKDNNSSSSVQNHTSNNGMPDNVRAKMETSLGADFSNVNIHTNSSSAQNVNALAYTQGSDIHFAPGQYNPNSKSGQELLGHELAHVVQQRQGRVKPTTSVRGMPVNNNPGLETEADNLGAKAANQSATIQQKKDKNDQSLKFSNQATNPESFQFQKAHNSGIIRAHKLNTIQREVSTTTAESLEETETTEVINIGLVDTNQDHMRGGGDLSEFRNSALSWTEQNNALLFEVQDNSGIQSTLESVIQAHPNRSLGVLGIFGHGSSRSGWVHMGDIGPILLSESISSNLAPDLRVVLYMCLAGADPGTIYTSGRSEEEQPGETGEESGGLQSYASRLSASLSQTLPDVQVWAHTTRAHTTRNPNWRVFEESPEGDVTGEAYFRIVFTDEFVDNLHRYFQQFRRRPAQCPQRRLRRHVRRNRAQIIDWLYYDYVRWTGGSTHGDEYARRAPMDPEGVAQEIRDNWLERYGLSEEDLIGNEEPQIETSVEEETSPVESAPSTPSESQANSPSDESIQTKLKIGSPNDKYEKEADGFGIKAASYSAPIQKKDEKVAKKSAQEKIMPGDVIQKMESTFGTSFSDEKILKNSAQANKVNALAFAQGTDIHFAAGQFKPDTQSEQELIVHELAHIVQQRQGRVKPTTQMKGMNVNADPVLEKEADEIGAKTANIQIPFQKKKQEPQKSQSTSSIKEDTTSQMKSVVQMEEEEAPQIPNDAKITAGSTKFTYDNNNYEVSGIYRQVKNKLLSRVEAGSIATSFTEVKDKALSEKTLRVDSIVSIIKSMPVWKNFPEIEKKSKNKKEKHREYYQRVVAVWNSYYASLDAHEEEHKKIDKQIFSKTHSKMIGKTYGEIDNILSQIEEKAEKKHKEFHASKESLIMALPYIQAPGESKIKKTTQAKFGNKSEVDSDKVSFDILSNSSETKVPYTHEASAQLKAEQPIQALGPGGAGVLGAAAFGVGLGLGYGVGFSQRDEHTNRNVNNQLPTGVLIKQSSGVAGNYIYDEGGDNNYVDNAERVWVLMSEQESVYHQPIDVVDGSLDYNLQRLIAWWNEEEMQTLPNKKFISRDDQGGSFEAVLQPNDDGTYTNNWLNSGTQQGTYNYSSPQDWPGRIGHLVQDVIPHYIEDDYASTPTDSDLAQEKSEDQTIQKKTKPDTGSGQDLVDQEHKYINQSKSNLSIQMEDEDEHTETDYDPDAEITEAIRLGTFKILSYDYLASFYEYCYVKLELLKSGLNQNKLNVSESLENALLEAKTSKGYYSGKGSDNITQSIASEAKEYYSEYVIIKNYGERAKALKARLLLKKSISKARSQKAKLNGKKGVIADGQRLAYRNNDESALAKFAKLVLTINDSVLALDQVITDAKGAIGSFKKWLGLKSGGELPSADIKAPRVLQVMQKINIAHAAISAVKSTIQLISPGGVTEAQKGLSRLSASVSLYGSVATLVGASGFVTLYANLYLGPMTSVCLRMLKKLNEQISKGTNRLLIEEGLYDKVVWDVEPGGRAMFDFMLAVMRAGGPSDIPRPIPGLVESEFLDNQDKLNKGTGSKGNDKLPTKGYIFEDLDEDNALSWIFHHRNSLWAMFYGDCAVPQRKEGAPLNQNEQESEYSIDIPTDVNIHTNSQKAVQLKAQAFTEGKDIHFAPRQFKPETQSGQELIGHELAHVQQQKEGKVLPTSSVNGLPINDDPSLEREADVQGRIYANSINEMSTAQRKTGNIQSPIASSVIKSDNLSERITPIQKNDEPGATPSVDLGSAHPVKIPLGWGPRYTRRTALLGIMEVATDFKSLIDEITSHPYYSADTNDLLAYQIHIDDLWKSWLNSDKLDENFNKVEASFLNSFFKAAQTVYDHQIDLFKAYLYRSLDRIKKSSKKIKPMTPKMAEAKRKAFASGNIDAIGKIQKIIESIENYNTKIDEYSSYAASISKKIKSAKVFYYVKKHTGTIGGMTEKAGKVVKSIKIIMDATGKATTSEQDAINKVQVGLDAIDFGLSFVKAVPLLGTLWSKYYYPAATKCLQLIGQIASYKGKENRQLTSLNMSASSPPDVSGPGFPGGQAMWNFMWYLFKGKYTFKKKVEQYFIDHLDKFNAGTQTKLKTERHGFLWLKKRTKNLNEWATFNKEDIWIMLYGMDIPFPGETVASSMLHYNEEDAISMKSASNKNHSSREETATSPINHKKIDPSVQFHENSAKAMDLGALAFTQGTDIHFAPGQFKPDTRDGQELIGHELAHLQQQKEGRVQPTTEVEGMPVNDSTSLEKEADDFGKEYAMGSFTGYKSSDKMIPSKDQAVQRKVPENATIPDTELLQDGKDAALSESQIQSATKYNNTKWKGSLRSQILVYLRNGPQKEDAEFSEADILRVAKLQKGAGTEEKGVDGKIGDSTMSLILHTGFQFIHEAEKRDNINLVFYPGTFEDIEMWEKLKAKTDELHKDDPDYNQYRDLLGKPGGLGKLYAKVNGNIVDVIDARGGPPVMLQDGTHTADPTKAGKYKLGKGEAYSSKSWYGSEIPWGSEISLVDGEIYYEHVETGRKGFATGPQSKLRSVMKKGDFYKDDGSGNKSLENTYRQNAFGEEAYRVKGSPGFFVHTTEYSERKEMAGEDPILTISHGCIHIKPSDRTEWKRKGYLKQGVKFTVKSYNMKLIPPAMHGKMEGSKQSYEELEKSSSFQFKIATLYYNQGKFAESRNVMIALLSHSDTNKKGSAALFHSIGSTYYKENNFKTALEYYEKAYAITKDPNSQKKIEDCKKFLSVVASPKLNSAPALSANVPIQQKAKIPSNVNVIENAEQASKMGALAFTRGSDIHFAPGQYQPETQTGQELIGHELAHVQQQKEGRVQPTTEVEDMPVNDNISLEQEADDYGKEYAANTKDNTNQQSNIKSNNTTLIQAKTNDHSGLKIEEHNQEKNEQGTESLNPPNIEFDTNFPQFNIQKKQTEEKSGLARETKDFKVQFNQKLNSENTLQTKSDFPFNIENKKSIQKKDNSDLLAPFQLTPQSNNKVAPHQELDPFDVVINKAKNKDFVTCENEDIGE